MSELAAALARIQGKLPAITKDETAEVRTKDGSKYSYSYANLTSITDQVMPLLAAEGLSFTCWPTGHDGGLYLHYVLMHSTAGDPELPGEEMHGYYPLPQNVSAQALGSAITYARRYCLCAVTGVAPDDEDDDGATASQAIIDGVRAEREGQRAAAERAPVLSQAGPPPGHRGPGNGRAVSGPLGVAPEERPGSIDSRQRSRMMIAFKALGVDDRGERLADTVAIVGRPLVSSNDLSWSEAEGVVRELEGRLARSQLGHVSQGSTP
jgi:hypothetical protein